MGSQWVAELREHVALFNRSRPWLNRRYWWSVVPLLCILGVLIASRGLNERSGAASVAIVMGFIYFVQKQRIAELTLFNSLFREFNNRYDGFNGKLRKIMATVTDLTPIQCRVLEDYFNLCAEEYFYFKHGIIDDEIWKSWCRGMLSYLGDDRIRAQWHTEEKADSHYGLTMTAIREGAGLEGIASDPVILWREAA
jgi:hypothetical protein